MTNILRLFTFFKEYCATATYELLLYYPYNIIRKNYPLIMLVNRRKIIAILNIIYKKSFLLQNIVLFYKKSTIINLCKNIHT